MVREGLVEERDRSNWTRHNKYKRENKCAASCDQKYVNSKETMRHHVTMGSFFRRAARVVRKECHKSAVLWSVPLASIEVSGT
jgi:hypothetical protein